METRIQQDPLDEDHNKAYLTTSGAMLEGTLSPRNTQEQLQLLGELYAHPLVQEAITLLEGNLSQDLYYHNADHTRSVIRTTILCACCDGLSSRDIELLAIAAAWHDTGYVEKRTANEPIGARLAGAAMRRHGGYSQIEIAEVVRAILDTEVQSDPESATLIQKANGRLSPWLLDGDLSNFGSRNFFAVSLGLLRELSGIQVSSVKDLENPDAVQFIAGTLRLLTTHEYKTDGACLLLGPQKELSIRKLGYLLAQLAGGTDVTRQNAWDELIPVNECE